MSTATWAAGDRASLATTPPSAEPPRSALRILGAVGRGLGARITTRGRGIGGGLFDLAAAGAAIVGATHLPGAWGDVAPWAIGCLSALIASAKLNP